MRLPFLASAPKLDPAKVVMVPDGVRAAKAVAAPGAVRAELGIPAGAPLIGAVARLARQKRLDRLVHVLAALPGVHALIAGEGPQHDPLQALARELGVGDRLHLAGFRRDVGDVLRALDVLVVSSDREGMANAMLEAMACGVPVVSTPVSGAHEALEADADGVAPGVVAGFAVDEIAAAVGALLRDGERRGRMGERAIARVEERFSFDTMVTRWEALLAGRGVPEAA
jgi:glycosyltransferase involved in cell wall biosynthesis